MFDTVLNALLSYMDKPWKVMSIIGLLIIGLLVYIVYEQRADITKSILHRAPHLLVEDYAREAPSLLAATEADVTQLVKVDLEANLAQPVMGFTRGGPIWMPNPSARPFIHERSDASVIVNILAGNAVCHDVPSDSPMLRIEYAAGLRRICFIGVPPSYGVLTGLLYIGWKSPPNPDIEYGAKVALQTAASQVSTY